MIYAGDKTVQVGARTLVYLYRLILHDNPSCFTEVTAAIHNKVNVECCVCEGAANACIVKSEHGALHLHSLCEGKEFQTDLCTFKNDPELYFYYSISDTFAHTEKIYLYTEPKDQTQLSICYGRKSQDSKYSD